jgi:hypothetical protein
VTRGFSTGSVLSRSLSIYGSNFLAFFLISLLLQGPFYVYYYMSEAETLENTGTMFFVSATFETMLSYMATGVITYGVIQQMRGRHANALDCIMGGFKHFVPVVLVAFVVSLSIFVGLLMCLVPGLIVMCVCWLSVPIAVVEGEGMGRALSRSNALTQGFRWRIFALLLVLGVIAIGFDVIIETVLFEHRELYWIASALSVALVSGWGSVANAVGYHDIRAAKENTDAEELARIFA